MARGFQVVERIARPPDEVWDFMADLGNAGRWMKGIDAIEDLDDTPMAAGKKLKVRGGASGGGETTLADWQPPNMMALRTVSGGVTATYTYACQPADGGGTEITLDARCEATGTMWKLMHPLIAALMKRHDAGQLAALKATMGE